MKIIKLFITLAFCLLTFVVLPTSATVRSWLAAPLVVHDDNARGNASYILAGGKSLQERLAAGADLLQMNRVSRIMLMRDDTKGPYNFKAHASWTGTQWALDFLAWRGVTNDKVVILVRTDGLFGTLREAKNVAKLLPPDVKKLVVVSSAPHMRRTVLAFRRSLPADVRVVPYAATSFEKSHEMFYPIWVEYFKLLVYYVVA